MDLHKRIRINNAFDHFTHIVRLVGIFRDNGIKRWATFVFLFFVGYHWRCVLAVLRHVTQQSLDVVDSLYFVGAGEMRNAAFRAMSAGTAKFFGSYVFVGYGFYYVWSG